jgi:SOS regulatory protein LexA
MKDLKKNESLLLSAIRSHLQDTGESPSIQELMAKTGSKSVSMTDRLLKSLIAKGYLQKSSARSHRSLMPTGQKTSGIATLPMWGMIHAGALTDTEAELEETLDVPEWMLEGPGEFACLKVRGTSMKNKGIFDGDVILYRRQKTASTGDVVIAMVNGEKTLKEISIKPNFIELIPYNDEMHPIKVSSFDDFQVLGIYTGLLRRLKR